MEEIEKYFGDRKDFITYAKEALGHNELKVKFKKLNENAVIPSYAHDGDVGMDLTAISVEYDEDIDTYVYHTGLSFETEKHYGIFLFPRSSNRKTDAYLCNSVGIADSAIYRGEILFCFKNRTSIKLRAEIEKLKAFNKEIALGKTTSEAEQISKDAYDKVMLNAIEFAPYNVGDRIGQMVVLPYPNVKLLEQSELSDSERGSNGFGSTGN